MLLNNLLKTTTKSKKRVGRGIGSGRGKTSGRGQKGQKARGKIPASQTGGGLTSLYKRLPVLRGWRNKPVSKKPVAIPVSVLSVFGKNSEVDLATLINMKLVDERRARKSGVKILGDGEISVSIKVVDIQVSKSAREKIEKAGGQVV